MYKLITPSLRKQKGSVTVEFAITGVVLFLSLFSVLEMGRALFVWNVMEEVVRRGARVATVCTANDPDIRNIAIFDAGAGSTIIPDLTTAHVDIDYLRADGTEIFDVIADADQIWFVRAAIQNYTHQLNIPFMNLSLDMSGISSTLHRESLGVARTGATPTGFSTC